MQSTSSEFAVNFSRLAVETYVDSNYSIVANILFKNKKENQLDPNLLLAELEDSAYVLPPKTRDIYIYLPYRMLNIFPTVGVFGNLDLKTGKKLREMIFYPTRIKAHKNAIMTFKNGITFDTQKGQLNLGRNTGSVKYFISTENTLTQEIKVQSQLLNMDGDYAVVYMKSYGKFVIMDNETFNSMYVQMFILGKYDKNLFELVVSSAYTKIYKLKK
jgi:dolichyl-diphosphooligosaccharide--protein glycosyltransferase/undecaprenyl-diphosphooligosaccharide--protein glycosyltransferase